MNDNFENQNEILRDMLNTNNDIKNDRKIKLLKVFLALICIFVFRILIGRILIPNIFGFPSGYNRYFLIEFNDKPLSIEYKITNELPIIPFIVYLKSSTESMSKLSPENVENFYYTIEKDIKMNIKSFECYNNKSRIRCEYYDKTDLKEKKLRLSNMKITHTSNPYKLVYEGEYNSNIGKYLKYNGSYTINITGKYGLNTVHLTTYIIKKSSGK